MKKLNLLFLPAFVLMTVIIRYDLFKISFLGYVVISWIIAEIYITVRGEKLRKWIVAEYPDVAKAKGGLKRTNMLGIVFVLNHNDGDQKLHKAKMEYTILSYLSIIWAFGGSYIIAALF